MTEKTYATVAEYMKSLSPQELKLAQQIFVMIEKREIFGFLDALQDLSIYQDAQGNPQLNGILDIFGVSWRKLMSDFQLAPSFIYLDKKEKPND